MVVWGKRVPLQSSPVADPKVGRSAPLLVRPCSHGLPVLLAEPLCPLRQIKVTLATGVVGERQPPSSAPGGFTGRAFCSLVMIFPSDGEHRMHTPQHRGPRIIDR
jgi:hypothetical protein